MFYGEEWIVKSGAGDGTWRFKNNDMPLGCLVWSGHGRINGSYVQQMAEFLITPNAEVDIIPQNDMCIYVFYPIPNET